MAIKLESVVEKQPSVWEFEPTKGDFSLVPLCAAAVTLLSVPIDFWTVCHLASPWFPYHAT